MDTTKEKVRIIEDVQKLAEGLTNALSSFTGEQIESGVSQLVSSTADISAFISDENVAQNPNPWFKESHKMSSDLLQLSTKLNALGKTGNFPSGEPSQEDVEHLNVMVITLNFSYAPTHIARLLNEFGKVIEKLIDLTNVVIGKIEAANANGKGTVENVSAGTNSNPTTTKGVSEKNTPNGRSPNANKATGKAAPQKKGVVTTTETPKSPVTGAKPTVSPNVVKKMKASAASRTVATPSIGSTPKISSYNTITITESNPFRRFLMSPFLDVLKIEDVYEKRDTLLRLRKETEKVAKKTDKPPKKTLSDVYEALKEGGQQALDQTNIKNYIALCREIMAPSAVVIKPDTLTKWSDFVGEVLNNYNVAALTYEDGIILQQAKIMQAALEEAITVVNKSKADNLSRTATKEKNDTALAGAASKIMKALQGILYYSDVQLFLVNKAVRMTRHPNKPKGPKEQLRLEGFRKDREVFRLWFSTDLEVANATADNSSIDSGRPLTEGTIGVIKAFGMEKYIVPPQSGNITKKMLSDSLRDHTSLWVVFIQKLVGGLASSSELLKELGYGSLAVAPDVGEVKTFLDAERLTVLKADIISTVLPRLHDFVCVRNSGIISWFKGSMAPLIKGCNLTIQDTHIVKSRKYFNSFIGREKILLSWCYKSAWGDGVTPAKDVDARVPPASGLRGLGIAAHDVDMYEKAKEAPKTLTKKTPKRKTGKETKEPEATSEQNIALALGMTPPQAVLDVIRGLTPEGRSFLRENASLAKLVDAVRIVEYEPRRLSSTYIPPELEFLVATRFNPGKGFIPLKLQALINRYIKKNDTGGMFLPLIDKNTLLGAADDVEYDISDEEPEVDITTSPTSSVAGDAGEGSETSYTTRVRGYHPRMSIAETYEIEDEDIEDGEDEDEGEDEEEEEPVLPDDYLDAGHGIMMDFAQRYTAVLRKIRYMRDYSLSRRPRKPEDDKHALYESKSEGLLTQLQKEMVFQEFESLILYTATELDNASGTNKALQGKLMDYDIFYNEHPKEKERVAPAANADDDPVYDEVRKIWTTTNKKGEEANILRELVNDDELDDEAGDGPDAVLHADHYITQKKLRYALSRVAARMTEKAKRMKEDADLIRSTTVVAGQKKTIALATWIQTKIAAAAKAHEIFLSEEKKARLEELMSEQNTETELIENLAAQGVALPDEPESDAKTVDHMVDIDEPSNVPEKSGTSKELRVPFRSMLQSIGVRNLIEAEVALVDNIKEERKLAKTHLGFGGDESLFVYTSHLLGKTTKNLTPLVSDILTLTRRTTSIQHEDARAKILRAIISSTATSDGTRTGTRATAAEVQFRYHLSVIRADFDQLNKIKFEDLMLGRYLASEFPKRAKDSIQEWENGMSLLMWHMTFTAGRTAAIDEIVTAISLSARAGLLALHKIFKVEGFLYPPVALSIFPEATDAGYVKLMCLPPVKLNSGILDLYDNFENKRKVLKMFPMPTDEITQVGKIFDEHVSVPTGPAGNTGDEHRTVKEPEKLLYDLYKYLAKACITYFIKEHGANVPEVGDMSENPMRKWMLFFYTNKTFKTEDDVKDFTMDIEKNAGEPGAKTEFIDPTSGKTLSLGPDDYKQLVAVLPNGYKKSAPKRDVTLSKVTIKGDRKRVEPQIIQSDKNDD